MTKLTFLGGARSVTGAQYLLNNVLIDCGMVQAGDFCDACNYGGFKFNPRDIKAVLISHAHIDHTGLLPRLVKEGYRGPIFVTPPTKALITHLFQDSVKLLQEESRALKRELLYGQEDADRALSQCVEVDYHQPTRLKNNFNFEFLDAGHILGSSIISVKTNAGHVVFSGDLGNPPVPLLKPTDPPGETDYLIVESTYGDRLHENRDARRHLLEDAIEDTASAKGTLLMPAFALERTQEILYEIKKLIEENRVPRIPVYIDSPLMIALTEEYEKFRRYFKEDVNSGVSADKKIFDFPQLKFCESREESKKINTEPSPKIIIAGSGMMNGGRVVYHAHRYLPHPENTILFIGFQAPGTLGRQILGGADEVNIKGRNVKIRAKVKSILGYSAHPDQEGLVKWVAQTLRVKRPKTIFTVQGDEHAVLTFAQVIRDNLGIKTEAPRLQETFEL